MREQVLIMFLCTTLTAAFGQSNIGVDNNPILNSFESEFLNSYFGKGRATFDFADKKICFISGSTGKMFITKQAYFSDIKKWNETGSRISTMLYVLTTKEKAEAGGYDAIVTAW